ncbi:lactamase [Candidatus Shapirobacteria bacterium CG11_big_fil_rev_8_21_14_0_20_40_12]|uniref:Lactamase n=2 Tax=Candidatus Shapironibacteriota TaxID=1752721 RepID=A0A2M8EU86_9BACT|nr:MAG: lactamase [Candidatus Shapirobacteria bacterium CG11_big_fil_rev_8_21_14_0_20_40_12]PJC28674.1 MAG: lactamase [Candidatus Shapirobacteria bacterium CG_4_9_14_0_2_um_filter_40_11]
MEVIYLGHSSFKFRGKSVTVVTDPYDPEYVGLKYPKTEADIVTVSHNHPDHNFISIVGGGPFVISQPGEYEIKGVSIFGFSSYHDDKQGAERGKNIIYLIEVDGFRICHLGDLGERLSSELIEEIGTADILCIPVGGKVTLGTNEAVELTAQIEPSIVLPMHFNLPGINQKIFGDLNPVDEFLSKMEVEDKTVLDKLSISKDKLPEETKVVILERKG